MKATKSDNEVRNYDKKDVNITNLSKVFWHKEGFTKGDLINYYESMAPNILPYLIDKPLSLNRHPDGADKPNFFQKDVDLNHLPNWTKTTQIFSESNQKVINYLLCNDKASLIYMANLGCIEINPWLSTYTKPNYPEYMVIDLDPSIENSFKQVVKVALETKSVLDKMGIKSFIKTSGSEGMHIYIFIAQAYEYTIVRKFAEYVAHKVHERMPELTSLERSPAKRKGLIYLDYLQNSKGQTIAAPYSVRPKPGATVSMPLYWDNVNENLDMNLFTMFTVPKIVNQREDPWKDLRKNKMDLLKSVLEI